MADFRQHIESAFQFKGKSIVVGGVRQGDQIHSGLHTSIPLKSLNRHGLIAGATGTGKTKTLQIIAEQLSLAGVPSLLMDIKGDLSGLAQPGEENDFIRKRHAAIDLPYQAMGLPVELLTISEGAGTKMKATVTEFGPVLLSKILGLNDTQASVMSLVFLYADKQQLPLIDLKDLRKLLQYLQEEGKADMEREYGTISSASTGAIMRKIIELEQQGAERFFGERSFDPQDLLRTTTDGKGMISILRLNDIQNKPKLFSTFMLSLLAEIYHSFPEVGDPDQPKLCLFIDEAHLVFEEASKALLDQIEVIVKLIRSKGVGIFFCTQNPTDVPDAVLSQLGLKVQHALRAFTAKDRKMIQKTAENYPISEFYQTDELLTQLGIGEALVSALNEKGVPTPLVHCVIRAPLTRMDILTDAEIQTLQKQSAIAGKYNENIDRESAYEILTQKLNRAQIRQEEAAVSQLDEKTDAQMRREEERARKEAERQAREQQKRNERMIRDVTRAVTTGGRNSIVNTLFRGLLGVLGVK